MSIDAIGSSGGLSYQDLLSMQEAMRTQSASVNSDASSVVAIGESGAISTGELSSDSQQQQQQQNQTFTPIDPSISYQENAHKFAIDQAVIGSSIQAFTSALSEATAQTQNSSSLHEQGTNFNRSETQSAINSEASSTSLSSGVQADSFVSQISGMRENQGNYSGQQEMSYGDGSSINTTLAMGFSNVSAVSVSPSLFTPTSSLVGFTGGMTGLNGDSQSGYLNGGFATEATSSQVAAVVARYSAQNQSQVPVSASFQPVSTYI